MQNTASSNVSPSSISKVLQLADQVTSRSLQVILNVAGRKENHLQAKVTGNGQSAPTSSFSEEGPVSHPGILYHQRVTLIIALCDCVGHSGGHLVFQ